VVKHVAGETRRHLILHVVLHVLLLIAVTKNILSLCNELLSGCVAIFFATSIIRPSIPTFVRFTILMTHVGFVKSRIVSTVSF
jgi:hypothetical protein